MNIKKHQFEWVDTTEAQNAYAALRDVKRKFMLAKRFYKRILSFDGVAKYLYRNGMTDGTLFNSKKPNVRVTFEDNKPLYTYRTLHPVSSVQFLSVYTLAENFKMLRTHLTDIQIDYIIDTHAPTIQIPQRAINSVVRANFNKETGFIEAHPGDTDNSE